MISKTLLGILKANAGQKSVRQHSHVDGGFAHVCCVAKLDVLPSFQISMEGEVLGRWEKTGSLRPNVDWRISSLDDVKKDREKTRFVRQEQKINFGDGRGEPRVTGMSRVVENMRRFINKFTAQVTASLFDDGRLHVHEPNRRSLTIIVFVVSQKTEKPTSSSQMLKSTTCSALARECKTMARAGFEASYKCPRQGT